MKRILYFADPMCSWCWGFSPVVDQIARACRGLVPIRLCAGGLRAGETRVFDDRAKAYVRQHWEHVQSATGQPFNYAFFARAGFVYDTEPACRASIAARSLAPELSLDYLAAVQHAFYMENRDVTREDVLADVATALGFVRENFVVVYRAQEVAAATRADFALARKLGVPGFPTIVLQDDSRLTALSTGYRPYDEIEPAMRAWLG